VCALATFPCLGNLLHGDVKSDKLRRTEHAVEAYRAQIDTHKAENYGFASMAAVPYAHIVAQLLGNKRPKGTEISLAPNPKDIVSKVILALVCYTHFGLHRSGKT
jgi:Cytosolic domain of 10TM putative phosphate transporter